MAEYTAGEAKLSIVPDSSGFLKRLEADLKSKNAEFAVRITADTTRAGADIDRFRTEQENRPIKIRTEVDKRSLDGIKKDFDAVGVALGSALKWNLGAAGVGELPALATALATVTGAAQQLAGAGVALPGVIGGIVASVGVAKLGVMGMSDAFDALTKASSGSAKDIDAANKALAKLAPQAADAVRSVHDLTPEFEGLQKLAAGNIFEGFSKNFKTLVDSDLPTLRTGIDGISKSLGQNLNQVLASLGSDSSKGLLDRILGNTGDAQARLTKAIDPLIKGVATLTAAGTDVLPRLADDLGAAAEKFSAFITTADQNGTLTNFINNGITGVEQLGTTFINVGKIINTVTQAAGGGDGLLSMLANATGRLDAFLKTPEGQNALLKFFAEGKRELGELFEVLKQLPGIADGVFSAARNAADTWLPVLKDISTFLSENKTLVEAVGTAFLAWKVVGVVTSVSTAIGALSAGLGAVGPAATAAGTAGAAGLAPLLTALGAAALALDHVANVTPSDFDPGKSSPGHILFGPTWDALGGNPNAAPPAPGPPPLGNKGQSPSDRTAPPGPVPPMGPDFQSPSDRAVPGHAMGGPTLSKRNGPTGGYIAELHPDEWVLPAHARKAVGDDALWALTTGRSFAPGGYVDQYGNPVTPGPTPGGGVIAPNPTQGGIGGIFSQIISGIQGPIGNAMALGQGLAGQGGIPGMQTVHGGGTVGVPGATPSIADRFAQTPGLFGLLGSMGSSDPGGNLMNWGEKTGQWLGNFTAKTVGSFATTLWQGGLDAVGLGNSILSPNNSWNQAGQSIGDFAFGSDGPLGQLLGANSGAGSSSSTDPKKLREAQDRISDKDASLAAAQARLAELPADASQSRRISAQNAVDKATREAAEARADASTLASGGGSGAPAYANSLASSSFTPPAGSGSGGWRPLVEQIVAARGLGPGWVDPLLRQIQTESGGNPMSRNDHDSNGRGGTQSVAGLFNFLPSTFSGSGGRNIWDPADQINTAITYVQGKYGQSNGVPNWIGTPGRGFAAGGPTPQGSGPLPDGGYPAVVHPGEFMISKRGRSTVSDSFLHQLNAGQLRGFLVGGDIPDAAVPNRPNFTPTTTAHTINTPAPRPSTAAPSGPPTTQAQAPQAPASVAPQAPQAPGQQNYGGGAQIAAAPSNLDHNLPAISKGITSAASTIGTIASMAIAGGMGGAGIPGGGAAGQFAAGLIQEGGKVVNDIVNVGSSFLVGSVPGSQIGTGERAFGQTVMPQQNAPVTSPGRGGTTYQFNGISDVDRIAQYMDLRDAQGRAGLARYGG